MMEMIFFMLLLIILGLAAHQWGVNSSDGPESPEWERRQRWYGGKWREHSRHLPYGFH